MSGATSACAASPTTSEGHGEEYEKSWGQCSVAQEVRDAREDAGDEAQTFTPTPVPTTAAARAAEKVKAEWYVSEHMLDFGGGLLDDGSGATGGRHCSVCRSPDHDRRRCPERDGERKAVGAPAGPGWCGNCRATGHTRRTCTKEGGGRYDPHASSSSDDRRHGQRHR